MMNTEELRKQFPQLAELVYGKPLVYLDNAATSLRPLSVVRKWEEMSLKYNANLHRAVHHTAEVATEEFEKARDKVSEFINAAHREEIIFTSGATASINLVAYSFGEVFVGEGDEIVVTESEHHSNIVPWQMLCTRKKAQLKVLKVDDNGEMDIDSLSSLISPRTKLVCIAQISNVLGVLNPVKEIVNICHSKGCKALVDGAQGVVHAPVDVRDLDCDFYAFSGHKLYAAPGTGVLYGKRELLEALPPFLGGGEMIGSVSWDKTTYAHLPHKFEAGTQNISGVPTLVPAIETAEAMRDPEVEKENSAVTQYLLSELPKIKGLRLYGVPKDEKNKISLFSFSVEHCHHEDLALIMDKMGIAIRSGQMCAEPLMDRFGVTGMLRASFAPYNTLREAEYFVQSLQKAIAMLK